MEAVYGGDDIKGVLQDSRYPYSLGGSHFSGAKWAQELSIKLMEVTHGQWLVRNFLIHDNVSGMLALEKKEDLQIAIEEDQAMGLDGLSEEDRYLMEINLDDLETASGEYQAYWLISVKAARDAFLIRRQQAQANVNAVKQPRIEMGVCLHSRTSRLYILPVCRLIDEPVNISRAY